MLGNSRQQNISQLHRIQPITIGYGSRILTEKHEKFRAFKQGEGKKQSSCSSSTGANKLGISNRMVGVDTAQKLPGELSELHMPRRLPTTPRKPIKVQNCPQRNKNKIKDLIHQLKSVIKQFHKLLSKIRCNYKEVLGDIKNYVIGSMEKYVLEYPMYLKEIPLLNISSIHKPEQQTLLNQNTTNMVQQLLLVDLFSKNSLVKTESKCSNTHESQPLSGNAGKSQSEIVGKKKMVGHSMAKIRENIKRNGSNIMCRKENSSNGSNGNCEGNCKNGNVSNGNDGSVSVSGSHGHSRMESANLVHLFSKKCSLMEINNTSKSREKKEITKSIEKLQLRLNSMKNILNQ